jgi:hypothetical protein
MVRVPHSCVVPNIRAFSQIWQTSVSDTFFMASPLTFDPSVPLAVAVLCLLFSLDLVI